MAPRRRVSTSVSCSADSSSQSSVTGGYFSRFPSSSHAIAKSQPIVRIVQVRPPKVIKADLANFRDIVHQFTGHQAATDKEEEGTANRKEQKTEEARTPESISATSLATDPPSLCSTSSASFSSSPSLSSSIDTTVHTKPTKSESSDAYNTAHCSLEHDLQEYGSVLTCWDGLNSDESTSKLLSRDGVEGLYSAWDSLTPFGHMVDLNNMNFNY